MELLVFLLSAGLILYVIAGYPLLLALLAHLFPKAVHRHPNEETTVSILIPVRNGAAFIQRKLDSIQALNYPPQLLEVLVISDGSEDATDAIVRRCSSPRVQLVRLPPAGKAAALNEGIRLARSEILLLTDVRQPLHPDALRNLLACFSDRSVGVVSGEVLIQGASTSQEADAGLFRRYESWIRTNLSRLGSMVGATGCLYAIRRSLIAGIPRNTINDDVYIPLKAVFQGYRCVFEPGSLAFDFPTSRSAEFRRKVRTQAGNYQLMALLPRLLIPSHPVWLHFVSLKLGRLLLPFALLSLAISTLYLPDPWKLLALSPQAAFYLLALVDHWIPERSPLKRASSPARSFLMMVAAALWGLSIFFLPAQRLWIETKVNTKAP